MLGVVAASSLAAESPGQPPASDSSNNPRGIAAGVVAATLLSSLAAVAWAIVRPPVGDMAAQVFRAKLFEQSGYQIWNGQWYGGHHLPGYSLLMPPLGGALGAWWAGCVAAVAASAAMAAVAVSVTPNHRRQTVITTLLCLAVIASLLSGRTTWLLGTAFAAASIAALIRGRTALALVAALLSPIASPVAAMFLALAGVAAAFGQMRKRGIAVAAAATLPGAAIALAFPEGGSQPFPATSFIPIALVTALIFALVPTALHDLKAACGLYLLLLVGTLVVSSPIGSNAVRLGQIAGTATVAIAFWAARSGQLTQARKAAFALAFAAIFALQWIQPVMDLSQAANNRSADPEFHTPLVAKIQSLGGPPGRLEVLWTKGHWEDAYVAPDVALARGWERQLDRRFNSMVSGPNVDAATYYDWLDSLAVRWVAVPNVQLDGSVSGEAKLVAHGLARLQRIWATPDWTLYSVADPKPIATGVATATQMSSRELLLNVSAPGTAAIQVRWSRWWRLEGIKGCLQPGPLGMTTLKAQQAGLARLSIIGLAGGPRCD